MVTGPPGTSSRNHNASNSKYWTPIFCVSGFIAFLIIYAVVGAIKSKRSRKTRLNAKIALDDMQPPANVAATGTTAGPTTSANNDDVTPASAVEDPSSKTPASNRHAAYCRNASEEDAETTATTRVGGVMDGADHDTTRPQGNATEIRGLSVRSSVDSQATLVERPERAVSMPYMPPPAYDGHNGIGRSRTTGVVLLCTVCSGRWVNCECMH